MNNIRKIRLIVRSFILFLILIFVSCTKDSDEIITEADMEVVSNDEFSESDNDLLTVDYKEFYDELAPHGEWIEVMANDIGVDADIGSSAPKDHRSISFSDFFGVKDAYADDVAFGAFFVWKPSPNLAVGVTAGGPVEYIPYTYGNWVYTDVGWYFRAASEPVEITHHYGRWVYSPAVGWVWVPGRVWAPSWVEWRESDTYIAWAPISPSVYIINNVIVAAPIIEERYIIVEKRYFFEPTVYTFVHYNYQNDFEIDNWHRIDGIMVTGNTVINKGPDITVIRNITGHPINTVKINRVISKNKVKYTENSYNVFSPEFKRVKMDVKTEKIVNSPKKFSTFKDASAKKEENERSNETKEKNESTSDNKDKGKENKKYDVKGDKGNYKEKDEGNTKENMKNKNREKISGENKEKSRNDKENIEKNKRKNDSKNENTEKSNKNENTKRDGKNDNTKKDGKNDTKGRKNEGKGK